MVLKDIILESVTNEDSGFYRNNYNDYGIKVVNGHKGINKGANRKYSRLWTSCCSCY